MKFSKEIIRYRAENQLTQEELAKKLGVDKSLICKLEKGAVTPSNFFTVKWNLLTGKEGF